MSIDAPIHTNEANLSRVLNAGLPVLLVFWKRDCPACDRLAPALDSLAKAYTGRALVAKVNIADEPGLARRYATAHLPALFFFKEGQQVQRATGAAGERELAAWLDYLTRGGAQPPVPSGPSTPVHAAMNGAAMNGAATRGAAASRAEAAAPQGAPVSGHPLVLTDATFDQALRGKLPVLVDFWAEWCGPCKMIAPAVAQLAGAFAGGAVVAKMNVDENPRVPGRFGIQSIPTLLIFRDGQVVDQIVGAQPIAALRQRLARQVSQTQ